MTGAKPSRLNAADKRSVRPTRSASTRTATAPASGTTTPPSAVTNNPCEHEERFTWKVLLSLAERDPSQASFSQARTTFQLINTALKHAYRERSGLFLISQYLCLWIYHRLLLKSMILDKVHLSASTYPQFGLQMR
jgi:hypothetical protein